MNDCFFNCCRDCVQLSDVRACGFKHCGRYRDAYSAYMKNARKIAKKIKNAKEQEENKIIIK